ncbi:Predicted homoserine dehydrogenase [Aedoeadaptatus ivorii]|uniref:Predicted homoserine dehydrogenase n=1 Tax=Aedoeadaptatus ivorii TaxID=54006 RepID=A0A448V0X7_9FIRM|nr:3-hydroxyacyl-CoA dehydrogenase NAD-binding domain-containing protein [Peptoniphilus ivorii]MDQ0507568.1 putative homoserine dehydrogenase-like protein [Peptoniphilus ivorii]VEJ35175.1 Predicted homoserine dehydrogenase [Peptoniphilus ivorii]
MKIKDDLEQQGPIRVAVVGAGLMGTGLVAQLLKIKGMEPVLWASRNADGLQQKLEDLGLAYDAFVDAKTIDAAKAARSRGEIALTTENRLAWEWAAVDVIVDCTGNTEAGAEINEYGLENGKHIVSLNVECDVLLGPYFLKKAREKGLCYTGTAGDEPGSIMELYEFADFLGFDIVCAGKGKNNPLRTDATPEELAEEAAKKGISPRMLTSFVDGTNTMIELNAVSNATGLVPDVFGCHGIEADIHGLKREARQKEDGGRFSKKGVVEFVHGIAPGVFVAVKTDDEVIRREMPYLSMGEGPSYILYRPYHLTNIETPMTIAKAVLYQEPTIAPTKGYIAHTVAIAKRAIKKGETLGGIGSDAVYGKITEAAHCYGEGLVPVGLITEGAVAKRDIAAGHLLTFADVVLDEETKLVEMFRCEHEDFYSLPN